VRANYLNVVEVILHTLTSIISFKDETLEGEGCDKPTLIIIIYFNKLPLFI